MSYVIIIAGLSVELFDRMRRESDNRIAPNGHVVMAPIKKETYTSDYIDLLIDRAYSVAHSMNEAEPFKTLLVYVDYEDAGTDRLKEAFFPFSLSFPVRNLALPAGCGHKEFNREANDFCKRLLDEAKRIRRLSDIVSSYTNVANMTPLLLPPRNFRMAALGNLLRLLYDRLPFESDPKGFIEAEVQKFRSSCPAVTPPSEKRNCFSDGQLFFRSPGKDRHGYFRNAGAERHAQRCLLNARSRIGGTYSHSFHYDCTPVKGKLDKIYVNCHQGAGEPKKNHVNISPNDYVI